jgi:hypothetical protein
MAMGREHEAARQDFVQYRCKLTKVVTAMRVSPGVR